MPDGKEPNRIIHATASALNKRRNYCLVKLFWIRIDCKMNHQLWFNIHKSSPSSSHTYTFRASSEKRFVYILAYVRIFHTLHCWHFVRDSSLCGGYYPVRSLCGGYYPLHRRLFSSIPGLCVLDASSTHLPVMTTKKHLWTWLSVSLFRRHWSSLAQNHWSEWERKLLQKVLIF